MECKVLSSMEVKDAIAWSRNVLNSREFHDITGLTCTLHYTVWRPLSRDILLSIFEMFHWPLGCFRSNCAAQLQK